MHFAECRSKRNYNETVTSCKKQSILPLNFFSALMFNQLKRTEICEILTSFFKTGFKIIPVSSCSLFVKLQAGYHDGNLSHMYEE